MLVQGMYMTHNRIIFLLISSLNGNGETGEFMWFTSVALLTSSL